MLALRKVNEKSNVAVAQNHRDDRHELKRKHSAMLQEKEHSLATAKRAASQWWKREVGLLRQAAGLGGR